MSMITVTDTKLAIDPILPGSSEDFDRRTHTRLRRRMLAGTWRTDLIDHLRRHFDPVRQSIQGVPDISTNVFLSVVQQLSALYSTKPAVSNPDGGEALIDMVASAGWWSMAPRLQRLVLGLRECFVRPSFKEGSLLYRIITPDMLYTEASMDSPDEPNFVVEARPRHWNNRLWWTWDVVDLRDPTNPKFAIILPKQGDVKENKDITVDIMRLAPGESLSGTSYPWRDSNKAPVMPYVLYHAERTGYLFDAYEGAEMVEGALTVAVLWTFFLHNVRDCSWSQKYTLNAELQGLRPQSEGDSVSQHRAISTDGSSILQFMSDPGASAAIGQWAPAVNPQVLGDAIAQYETRLSVHYNLSPSDYVSQSTPQSGYAISLKRESVREAQRKFEEQFRRGDVQLMRVSAVMSGQVPEEGYQITYPGLPVTSQELTDSLAKHKGLIDLGLASKVDAFRELNAGISREVALQRLREIAEEIRTLG